jgi:gamma-glutamyltranspeptidase/glutathione hydrolase
VRLAGAIAQVAWRVLATGAPVGAAIDAPRMHSDGSTLHLEGGWSLSPEDVQALEAEFEVVRWSGRNLFFGGVQAVELRSDGVLAAGGDPRRGGVGVVVE